MNLIVPVLNRYDLLNRMIGSLTGVDHLLIIDNGRGCFLHGNGTRKVTVLHMPANLGCASSWNLGIKCFPHDPVWFFGSVDIEYQPGALDLLATAKLDRITLCKAFPHWQTFAIGEEVVRRIGLFDEGFHPLYWEDIEYTHRAQQAGIAIDHLDIDVKHEASATMHATREILERNRETFQSNKEYWEAKKGRNDLSQGAWSLDRRRSNDWPC